MIISVFRPWTYVFLSLSILVFGIGYVTFESVNHNDHSAMTVLFLAFVAVFVLLWFVFVFMELKNKAVVLEVSAQNLIVKNFLGFGIKKIYAWSDFNGFNTNELDAESGSFEYLFLQHPQKRIVVSQYYHKNYQELKREISKYVKNRGTVAAGKWTIFSGRSGT
jgi:hypothetical protein